MPAAVAVEFVEASARLSATVINSGIPPESSESELAPEKMFCRTTEALLAIVRDFALMSMIPWLETRSLPLPHSMPMALD